MILWNQIPINSFGYMFILYVFVLGLCIGSFANVLIDRLSLGQSINGRSHCDYCQKQLMPLDLIPVISFIASKGRSRCCNKKLSWQYPLVEGITGILFVIIYISFIGAAHSIDGGVYAVIKLLAWAGIGTSLLVIFISDVKYQIIPDEIQIVLGSLSLLLQVLIAPQFTTFYMSIFSGVAVMLPILAIYLATKKKGMGFGDVKLAFCMGILLGTKGGLIALYIAFLVGACVGLLLIIGKKVNIKSKIAFGPFLIIGIVGVLIWGPQLKDIVYRVYGI